LDHPVEYRTSLYSYSIKKHGGMEEIFTFVRVFFSLCLKGAGKKNPVFCYGGVNKMHFLSSGGGVEKRKEGFYKIVWYENGPSQSNNNSMV